MSTDSYPRSEADVLALPIGPAFSSREMMCDGRKVIVPVMSSIQAFFVEPDMVLMASNAKGRWTIGRYADGRYFRRRA